jgi:L-fuculose-phosphate aldolase
MIEDAIRIGKLLAEGKLIDGASGNLSFRKGDNMIITKSGVCLDDLNENSFAYLKIDSDEVNPVASVDQIIHREIYRKTEFNAVIHCHGVFNVVLGHKFDRIEPADLEGSLYFGYIPVVIGEFGTVELANKISDAVRDKGVAIVRGHGIYSAGEDLRDAFNKAAYVEHSCEVRYRLLLIQS